MKFYNTLTRKLEEFVPIEPGKVKMYVCGPTVYNYFHLGNARPFVVFDTLRRFMEYIGYDVTYVQNFTDIDDKIINRAKEEGISTEDLAEKYIEEYYKDARALGIKDANYHPKATEHVKEIIDIIQKLVDKGYAYFNQGDVYFDTAKFEEYGKLSKQSLEDLELGARIEVKESKRNATDFVLWKAQKPGEPGWNSPWGVGRPGWHIECSAMSSKYLGETIDIHAGGQDLAFPHHENEIAQSECAFDKPFVRYWLHNGFINVDNEKMSKSLNNFFTIRDISKEIELEVVRLFLLSAHYRSPINYSKDLLEQSQNALERLYNAKNNLEYLLEGSLKEGEVGEELLSSFRDYKERFIKAMENDINTADALGVVFELVRYLNSNLKEQSSKSEVEKGYGLFMELTGVLGLLNKEKQGLDQEVERLIQERQRARKEKNWALSDKIRDDLKAMGIVLEDTPQGVKWKRV